MEELPSARVVFVVVVVRLADDARGLRERLRTPAEAAALSSTPLWLVLVVVVVIFLLFLLLPLPVLLQLLLLPPTVMVLRGGAGDEDADPDKRSGTRVACIRPGGRLGSSRAWARATTTSAGLGVVCSGDVLVAGVLIIIIIIVLVGLVEVEVMK